MIPKSFIVTLEVGILLEHDCFRAAERIFVPEHEYSVPRHELRPVARSSSYQGTKFRAVAQKNRARARTQSFCIA